MTQPHGDPLERLNPESAPPLITTSPAELRATTATEFIALLRTIHLRSGLTLPEISRRAGQVLPRSQVYSLLKRGKLPTKPEQVRAFVKICGLPDSHVARVMELWVTLRGTEDEKAPAGRAGAFSCDQASTFSRSTAGAAGGVGLGRRRLISGKNTITSTTT